MATQISQLETRKLPDPVFSGAEFTPFASSSLKAPSVSVNSINGSAQKARHLDNKPGETVVIGKGSLPQLAKPSVSVDTAASVQLLSGLGELGDDGELMADLGNFVSSLATLAQSSKQAITSAGVEKDIAAMEGIVRKNVADFTEKSGQSTWRSSNDVIVALILSLINAQTVNERLQADISSNMVELSYQSAMLQAESIKTEAWLSMASGMASLVTASAVSIGGSIKQLDGFRMEHTATKKMGVVERPGFSFDEKKKAIGVGDMDQLKQRVDTNLDLQKQYNDKKLQLEGKAQQKFPDLPDGTHDGNRAQWVQKELKGWQHANFPERRILEKFERIHSNLDSYKGVDVATYKADKAVKYKLQAIDAKEKQVVGQQLVQFGHLSSMVTSVFQGIQAAQRSDQRKAEAAVGGFGQIGANRDKTRADATGFKASLVNLIMSLLRSNIDALGAISQKT